MMKKQILLSLLLTGLLAGTNNQAALRGELSDMCFSITERLR